MNTIKIEEEKEKKEKRAKRIGSDEDDLFRVIINKESNDILGELVRRANEDFDGGEISKSDIANLLILNHGKSFSEYDIKTLRHIHFDEKKVLRSLLKKAGEEGDLPAEIKRALREHLGLTESNKKRFSKNQNDLSTEKVVDI